MRGSAVISPFTSVQISTRSASSAAPRSEAVKSEPPRPSVVGKPSAVAPMNPCVTGTRPAPMSGRRHSRARAIMTGVQGIARPNRSSVTMIGRMSTQVASSPAPTSAAATSRLLQSSPRPASMSSSAGRSRRPNAALSS